MSCDNCGHRVIRVQLGESMITMHYGAVALCQNHGCRCEKPE